ncbi:MAG TPA: hydantoinase/oxoprolinase family protein [Thermodesulfobacteriota bacterium]|nr:hydantoinase/oxoprolinase family protein [Thermodesulfobacteriota bacterium]
MASLQLTTDNGQTIMIRIGIDTGGTFTDFAFFDGRSIKTHKVPSTPLNPSQAILEGLRDVLGRETKDVEIVHGTTVATNALLERKGARITLVTTEGFEDVIEIGRQNRGELYNLFWEAPQPLVKRELRFGVRERTSFVGKILIKVDEAEVKKLISKLKKLKVEGIAISFLHSYANPENEEKVEKLLKPLGVPISTSSKILPEFREYERTSTIVANSYLLPKVKTYMFGLSEKLSGSRVFIMQSGGGVISPGQAGDEPVRLLLSGPAGGVVGGFKIASAIGHKKVITYDMGGTSTDVALSDGSLRFVTETKIEGIPIKIPMVDVVTIGAGGGSIAYLDPGGALKVGPASAGADPGPACYGKGLYPTVTDANLVLGRINPNWFLGGRMKIFPRNSESALKGLADQAKLTLRELAEGIIKVANANMERALRVISISRGFDPREFSLLSFGGAGGLHACELALGLGIKTVIFPRDPGILSALGMLMADSFKDYSLTTFLSGEKATIGEMEKGFKALESKAQAEFAQERIKFERFLDARYRRQSHEITIPYGKDFVRTFHQAHKKMYGYSKPENDVEIVTLRIRAIVSKKKIKLPHLSNPHRKIESTKEKLFFNNSEISANYYRRDDFFPSFAFSGPAVVLESTATLFIPPGFRCEVDEWGNILAKI